MATLLLEAVIQGSLHSHIAHAFRSEDTMAGPAPHTRNWSAHENLHEPKGLVLIVHGQVEVTRTNQRAHLTEKPERDPKHLGLHLTIEDGEGPGHDTMCWTLATFDKDVKADEYDTVVIRWDVKEIARATVVDDSEHHKEITAKTAALNATHAKAGKRPSAPKAAAPKPAAPKAAAPQAAAAKKVVKKAAAKKAKKAAPKKAKKAKKKTAPKKSVAARAVKAVGGWAKGAKKALKRVIGKKKSAKKPAKKAKAKKKKR